MKRLRKSCIRLTNEGHRGCLSSRVDLWVHDHQAQWAEIGRKLYCGELRGMKAIKRSKEASVYFVDNLAIGGNFFIKRFFMRDRLDFFKHLFRHARALREYHAVRLAASLGMGVPEACCVLVKRCFGIVHESAIITRAVTESTPFLEYYQSVCDSSAMGSKGKVGLLMVSLANEVAKWHKAKLSHGEMHLENVLCKEIASGFEFNWVDNERTRRFKGEYDQVRNLAELNQRRAIDPAHRLVFWKRYCQKMRIGKTARHDLLKKVAAKSRHGVCGLGSPDKTI